MTSITKFFSMLLLIFGVAYVGIAEAKTVKVTSLQVLVVFNADGTYKAPLIYSYLNGTSIANSIYTPTPVGSVGIFTGYIYPPNTFNLSDPNNISFRPGSIGTYINTSTMMVPDASDPDIPRGTIVAIEDITFALNNYCTKNEKCLPIRIYTKGLLKQLSRGLFPPHKTLGGSVIGATGVNREIKADFKESNAASSSTRTAIVHEYQFSKPITIQVP